MCASAYAQDSGAKSRASLAHAKITHATDPRAPTISGATIRGREITGAWAHTRLRQRAHTITAQGLWAHGYRAQTHEGASWVPT